MAVFGTGGGRGKLGRTIPYEAELEMGLIIDDLELGRAQVNPMVKKTMGLDGTNGGNKVEM